ncbi:MAG: fumarylacetoacetate hydrolase family protein [Micrococcales bacterium]
MRIARFMHNDVPTFGLVDDDELVLFKGHPLVNNYETTGERVSLSEVKLLPPVIPSKIVCVGKNYAAHAEELGFDLSEEPTLFFKPSSGLAGSGQYIVLPEQSNRVELEAELAIVIGKYAKNVTEENAAEHIWGFTIANDVTARDLQLSDDQWDRSKAFDTFCPLGPWIETEFVPGEQHISSTINGHITQDAPLSEMIHNPYEIVSYISKQMTLIPGDVILTGTPAGIIGISAGDVIECIVEGIGTLRNTVV